MLEATPVRKNFADDNILRRKCLISCNAKPTRLRCAVNDLNKTQRVKSDGCGLQNFQQPILRDLQFFCYNFYGFKTGHEMEAISCKQQGDFSILSRNVQ
jgi:hypothetical protein